MSCFSFLFRKKEASRVNRPVGIVNRPVEIDEGVLNVKQYGYRELQIATENFSEENKIGQGGFGSVYKGTLKDGTLVAIKELSAESSQGLREFLTEIEVIATVEHDNLVKLYGCCAEGDHRILVYGYLENNSLAQTLLGRGYSGIQFTWLTRCKICIGVARGLAYLHEEVSPHIIHRDIKASNILLDKDLSPKISDFGLAKFIAPNLTHVSTRVAGTTGYLAPEYAIRGQVTRKADIYSFGVLLLEIVCGRSNTNRQLSPKDQYLLARAWEHHERGQLVELVDASLNGNFDVEEACRFLKVGLLCTQDMPKLRPSMSTVVQMLTGALDVNEGKISKPGLFSEFMGHTEGGRDKANKRGPSHTISTSGKFINSSSSSEAAATSFATMTFNSIYDRSN
ncbi:cold-responsive protein kinase 1 isoform X2 [Pyrus x bretschneideri]|uniref:cold-responsive protein kinase 1 isoform X2 n=1 Tax=Pyrus x bretschneideri TaxID=225117 RepID=UPI00202FF6E6|nr:cold-responsive protein kinase 1 isoform X2 [Pyrus x bretschneideri]